MLLTNYIRKAFLDLRKRSYEDRISYNQDKSGFVYSSQTLHQDFVFYPKSDCDKSISQISDELINNLYMRSLPYNILPFPIAFIFGLMGVFLMPYNEFLAVGTMLAVFFLVLYLAKMSLNVISNTLNFRIFIRDDFTVLKVREEFGPKSAVDDVCRSRPYSTFEQKSEILASTYFIEKRLMEQGEIAFLQQFDK